MANLNLNKVILGGRVVSDPELKQTPSGVSVLRLRVAVNRRYSSKNGEQSEAQADFFDVVVWRQTAEFVSKYFRKGSSICVVGSIQTRMWQDNQGQKRYSTEIVADEVNFVDSASEGHVSVPTAAPAQAQPAPTYSQSKMDFSAPRMESMAQDDDLPF